MNETNDEASPIPEKLGDWLNRTAEAGASDLHLIVGYPPVLRLHGDLTELPEPPLTGEEAHQLLHALCPPEAFTRLQDQKNVDFSFEFGRDGRTSRFRANLFHTGRQLGACLRVVPDAIPD